ncbi:PDZ domain-containing protein [Brevibacillus formosus]|uniref:PDZ domain-containing protein n=1 Tax=Brevibacillus TaxID=55080 RepID=UPI000D10F018|nr:PDZ domain-containing protein [Brevibacillus formosus]PSK12417.1 PDZ domain-containing protein [Brevibacillus sp. NRRL NRS-603]
MEAGNSLLSVEMITTANQMPWFFFLSVEVRQLAIQADMLTIAYGFAAFFINPVFYLFLVFIYLHYRRQMNLERQLFSARIQSPLLSTIRAVGMGLVGGLLISLLSAGLGVVVQAQDLWILWGLALILALIRLRFLCFAYAAGILAILHAITQVIPPVTDVPGLSFVWEMIRQAKPLPLLALVAVMHLIEAMLVRWNGGRDASPLFVEGQRGRIVGAYLLHSFWLTPAVLFVQMEPGAMSGALYPGWPFFSPGAASFGLMLLPTVTGFSDMTQTMTPYRKATQVAKNLMLYAIILLGLCALAAWFYPLILLAAIFALFGHEALFFWSQYQERKRSPYFIQSSRGVKVMGVIPGTRAEEIGITPGEIIVKVNGISVREKEDLYPALQANPAFCKMEVLTREGELKFVQCAVYAGNHHQLGIIVVPDANTRAFVDLKRASVVELIKQKLEKLNVGA